MIVQRKILRKVSDVIAGNDISDYGFPLPLSLKTRWLLLPIPLLMFVCFLFNDVYVKMGRDILITLVNVWFLLYTIKPHRKTVPEETVEAVVPEYCSESKLPRYKLSAERCLELERQITAKMESGKIYQNPTLTIESLAGQLDSNKNYVSEAINRGRFGSYYALINHYRVEHAIGMFRENPKQKIEYVSKASGFSSKSVFSQVFKRSKAVSPTQFIQDISSKTESE